MPDVPMRPDDITDEELEAATLHTDRLMPERVLAAQNALRDERVRADERERWARALEDVPGFIECRLVAARLREGGRA